MINMILDDANDRMQKAIEAYQRDLATVRTGRATPAMLDRVMVNYYGSPTPINQMAGVSVVEGRQLVIKPYDKSALKDIEHGIYEADLGLTPQNDGEIIRITVPALTEERRKEFAKNVWKFAEHAKVAVRNIRRDANDEIIDTWVTDYKTHRVPISNDFLKLSGEAKEYIYTLTEDATPAGFEIAESMQFKVQQADENVCLFVRENADAEWVRADKRLIQMIDEATPREDTPTPTPAPTPQPTPAATPAPTPAPTPHKVQTIPQTGDGFPLLAIVVVSLVSATGIVLLTVKQKNALKETSDKEDADESSDR